MPTAKKQTAKKTAAKKSAASKINVHKGPKESQSPADCVTPTGEAQAGGPNIDYILREKDMETSFRHGKEQGKWEAAREHEKHCLLAKLEATKNRRKLIEDQIKQLRLEDHQAQIEITRLHSLIQLKLDK